MGKKKKETMLRVEIDEDYCLDIDEMNFTLVRKSTTEEGKPTERTCGYYSTVDAALISAARLDLANQGRVLASIEDFMELYRETAERFHRPDVVARVRGHLDKLARAREERKEAERKKAREKHAEKKAKKPKPKPQPKKPIKKKRKPARA